MAAQANIPIKKENRKTNIFMVRNKIEIYCAQMAKNASKLYTMVGENFEIYCYQMAKNTSKLRENGWMDLTPEGMWCN